VSLEEHRKLLEIRLKSKRGGMLTDAEHIFCRNMYLDHPEEYKAMNAEVQAEVMKDFNPS